MRRGSERLISRRRKRHNGCLQGLFSMFNFHRAQNSPRLLSNREHGSGRIFVDDRYSSDRLEYLYDLAENDKGFMLPFQSEPEDRVSCGHIRIPGDEKITQVQQVEHSSFSENRQMLVGLGREVPLAVIASSNNFTGNGSHLIADDLANLRHHDFLMCPVHSLTETFCDGIEFATLFEEVYKEGNKDQATECRKNVHMDASVNTNFPVMCSPDEHNAKDNHNCHVLMDIKDELFHVDDSSTPGAIHQSVQLMNALKMPSSDEEFLYKLLQDQESKLTTPVQKLHHGITLPETVDDTQFQKQNTHDKEKRNSPEVQSEKGLLKRIVVLKPIPSRMENLSIDSSCISSPRSVYSRREHAGNRKIFHFSFQEIKKRLRHAIGERKKERIFTHRGKAINDGCHRVFFGSVSNGAVKKQMEDVNCCTVKNVNSAQVQHKKTQRHHLDMKRYFAKNGYKKNICILERETNFQREAKNHLIETMHSRTNFEHQPEKRDSKALWNILSLQEYDFSSGYGRGRRKELGSSPPRMRFSPLFGTHKQQDFEKHILARHDPEISDCSCASVGGVEPCTLNSNSELIICEFDHELSGVEGEEFQGMTEIKDPNKGHDAEFPKRICCIDEISDEDISRSSHGGDELDKIQENDKMRSSRGNLIKGQKSGTPSTPSILLIQSPEMPEIAFEKVDRPSPISILIPPFIDDATCSNSPVSEQREDVGLPVSPRELHFDEHYESKLLITSFEKNLQAPMGEEELKHHYIALIFEAYGLNHIETWEEQHSFCNLFDPSLFDRLEIPFGTVPYDFMLLFDCICEALEEMHEKYFPRKPWVPFVKHSLRPFPHQERLIQEVCGRTTSPRATQSQTSLNLLVGNDLDATIWIDTCSEFDNLGIAIEDGIMEEVLEELVYDVCDLAAICRLEHDGKWLSYRNFRT